jgi:addiction module RelE/StbE family toxin
VRLRWTSHARDDLLGIARFIASDNKEAASKWVAALRACAMRASEFPLSGRIVPELDRNDVRELIVRNYRVVYRIVSEEVHILTVFESHRLLRLTEESTSPIDKT